MWADLRGLNLTNANLIQANLTKADLRHADLTDANLAIANLDSADLSGATFIKAHLTSLVPRPRETDRRGPQRRNLAEGWLGSRRMGA